MSATTFLDGRVTLHLGDVRERLAAMAPDSVDCVVTSPPYWGLRDYQTATWSGGDSLCDHRSPTMREGRVEDRRSLAGSAATNSAQLLLAHRSACGKCGAIKSDLQIGLEPTLAEHLSVMVDVFEAVRRVLKPTGTLWLNYGDCYATSPNGRSAADTKAGGGDDHTFRDKPFSTIGAGALSGDIFDRPFRDVINAVKAKDLCQIPNLLFLSLRAAGWYGRSEIVWGKSNPMPDSSGTARPSVAHEKIFMLTKSADADVWRARDTGEISFSPDLSETAALITKPDERGVRWLRIGSHYDAAAVAIGRKTEVNGKAPDGWDTGAGGHGSVHRQGREKGKRLDKVRALTPRHEGHINHTGIEATPRGNGRLLRNYEPAPLTAWEFAIRPFADAHFATFPPELAERCILAGCHKGGTVLDPFGGAGTTALVALRHGRRAALIELNPEYAALARRRIESEWRVPVRSSDPDFGPLFAEAV